VPDLIEICSVVLKMCVQKDVYIICIFCEQGKIFVVKWMGLFSILFINLLLSNVVSC
jgi:hypothetical protein